MFTSALATISARLPSTLKLRLRRLRPYYGRILSSGETVMSVDTRHGNLKWRLDELTCGGHLTGKYEPYMQEAIHEFLRPQMVVYDVGAHAGFHTLFCALKAHQTVSFEPHPSNRASIERQINLNSALNIRLLPYALSDKNGPGVLAEPSNSSMAYVSSDGSIPIELRTIDSLVAEGVPPPDLIKVDVEGHELNVLRGCAKTIERYRPIILCDPNDESTAQSISNMLTAFNYEVTGMLPIVCLPREL